MDLQIIPKKLSGTVTPPPSKSQAHRLLIAAALSGGVSVLRGLADSDDIRATRRCLAAPCRGGFFAPFSPGRPAFPFFNTAGRCCRKKPLRARFFARFG